MNKIDHLIDFKQMLKFDFCPFAVRKTCTFIRETITVTPIVLDATKCLK